MIQDPQSKMETKIERKKVKKTQNMEKTEMNNAITKTNKQKKNTQKGINKKITE